MNEILEQPVTNVTVTTDSVANIRRIVVPVDLSAQSERTAAYAVALAKKLGASITFVHVFPTEAISLFTAQDGLETYERERDARKKELARFVGKIRGTYSRCDTEFRIGDAAEETNLAATEARADLIIAATYHPGLLGRLFGLGNAQRIVKQATCPVLVLKDIIGTASAAQRSIFGRLWAREA